MSEEYSEHEKCPECGCFPCECEDEDIEDIVEQNDLLLQGLIELLKDKGIISEDEFNSKVEKLEEEWYDDDDESEEENKQDSEKTPPKQLEKPAE